MPIYEYVCKDCGEDVEKLQKLSDAPLTDCPACGHASLKRKISAAGFRLSGGGWYETDFKSKGQRNLSGKGDSQGEAGTGKSDVGKAASPGTTADRSAGSKTSDSSQSATGSKPYGKAD